MPNVGAPELIIIAFAVLMSVATGRGSPRDERARCRFELDEGSIRLMIPFTSESREESDDVS